MECIKAKEISETFSRFHLMGKPAGQNVTRLLKSLRKGEGSASDELLPLVYEELRGLAEAKMACERPGLTLQATALVHEAYLRLVSGDDVGWDDRGHFFAAAAEAMRRILVERARRGGRRKHGGGRRRVSLEEADVGFDAPSDMMIALDEALTRLREKDRRKERVVMLRYFAGLTIEDTARALDVSPATVKNDWTFAKAWLYKELTRDE